MFKLKHKLVKATAAAALAFTGVSALNAAKPNNSVRAHVQAASVRVKVTTTSPTGVSVWNNYANGQKTGNKVQNGTEWKVRKTATDPKGRVWYKIAKSAWIEAKYTTNITKVKGASKAVAEKLKPTKPTNTARNTIKQLVKKSKKRKKHVSKQASSKAAAIVALAKSEVSKPYVWGATGPNAFDCSGLVQYVYKKAAGINLTRTTYTQVNQGRTVAMNQLKPGDLLFWGSASAPYHVGIYIGNGQYVNAATPQQGVIQQTLSSYFYPSVAKRILN